MPGWNFVNKLSTVAKPNLWRLMKIFQREEFAAKAKCASIVTGKWEDPNQGRTRKSSDRKEHLKDLVEKFTSVDIGRFLQLSHPTMIEWTV